MQNYAMDFLSRYSQVGGLCSLLVGHAHNCSLVRLVHGIRTRYSKRCCMTYHPSPNGVTGQPSLRHDGRAAGREAPADLDRSLALYQGFQVRAAVYKTPITEYMRTAGWLDQPLHCTARLYSCPYDPADAVEGLDLLQPAAGSEGVLCATRGGDTALPNPRLCPHNGLGGASSPGRSQVKPHFPPCWLNRRHAVAADHAAVLICVVL